MNPSSRWLTAVAFGAAAVASPQAPQEIQTPRKTPRPYALDRVDATDGGAGHFGQASTTDQIPLPNPAVILAGDAGDVVLEPASGDPFFLAFVGGAHYPPAAERIDPALLASITTAPLDGRASHETFAFVMFSKRITPDRITELEDLGCRVLGFHPHYAMKIAFPVNALDAIAALDFVRWLGVPRAQQKVHPRLVHEVQTWPANRPIDVYINVYDSDLGDAATYTPVGRVEERAPGGVLEATRADVTPSMCLSNGWQQLALQAAGVEVLEYVDRIRAFRCRIAPAAIEGLTGLDFVLFVEANLPDETAHDESMPLALLDRTRADFDGDDDQIASIGQIDSGVDTDHTALNHFYSVGWDSTGEGSSLIDDCEHGSHVAGTILALPVAGSAGFTGAAPGLGSTSSRRYFNVKKHSATCASSATSNATLFGHLDSDYTDGSGNVSPRPHAVNNSWGSLASIGSPFVGSEADPRTIDANVWDHSQLYVFAAGNEGSSVGVESMREEATAKNAFTVGSVHDYINGVDDPGSLASSSSQGPCGDGRWKPNVVAPGRYIRSVDANSGASFTDKSGTSMAAPHVTGLAAQLCDHRDYLQYAPHRLASLMMATSIPFQDENLTTQPGISDAHLNTYGAGRINAENAHWAYVGVTDRTNWGGTLNAGFFGFSDFTVDAGCIELVVVVTYHEDQCSAGAAQALVNDFDLYLDSPANGIDPAGNTGEYIAQQSSINNTEMRTFVTPATGTWRWKLYPDSATSSIRYSVTVQQIFDDTTPNGTLNVTADDTFVKPNDDVTITAEATNPQYYATAVVLESTSSGDTLQSASTTLDDGVVTDLTTNQSNGRDITLGSIVTNGSRSAEWVTRWNTEGIKTWSVDARSDTWVDESDSVQITVDGTPPSNNASNMSSTTHALNAWSNDDTLTMTWTAAVDALSGIDGYSRTWTNGSVNPPDTTKDIEQVTALNVNLSDGQWYFSLKAVDNCGNWFAGHTNIGPYKIDTVAPIGPALLVSTTHTEGVPSCNELVTVQWPTATDVLSGLAGYVVTFDTTANTNPTGAVNAGPNANSFAQNIGSSATARYAHVRAKDNAGNYGATRHFGPLLIDSDPVAVYCTAKTNSLGCLPTVTSTGQPDYSDGAFTVTCSNVVNNKNGLMFWGTAPLAAPFQGGFKCVASPSIRTAMLSSGGSLSGSDCSGSYAFNFTTSYMGSVGINPGDTIYCQFWMRDPPSPSTTGLSNAIEFTVCD